MHKVKGTHNVGNWKLDGEMAEHNILLCCDKAMGNSRINITNCKKEV